MLFSQESGLSPVLFDQIVRQQQAEFFPGLLQFQPCHLFDSSDPIKQRAPVNLQNFCRPGQIAVLFQIYFQRPAQLSGMGRVVFPQTEDFRAAQKRSRQFFQSIFQHKVHLIIFEPITPEGVVDFFPVS